MKSQPIRQKEKYRPSTTSFSALFLNHKNSFFFKKNMHQIRSVITWRLVEPLPHQNCSGPFFFNASDSQSNRKMGPFRFQVASAKTIFINV